MTEATEQYLETFCRRLRQERDREAGQHESGCGWPDILEKVCTSDTLKRKPVFRSRWSRNYFEDPEPKLSVY